MRKKIEKQLSLMPQIKEHPQSRELECISCILDSNPIIYGKVHQDLSRGKNVSSRKGANGMSSWSSWRPEIYLSLNEKSVL